MPEFQDPHGKNNPVPPAASNAESQYDTLATPTMRGREEPGQKDRTGYPPVDEAEDV